MNREVEERLVAMYFDNRDFEKNAKQTIDTLGQLKDSMNLEDSVKGFDVFSKMKRNLGMEQMQRSANKLKETFGSIGPVLNKAFQVGTGPLRSIEHAFSSLSGYVNKYLGFDFASKIVGGVESAVRQLTVQPVSQGFHQYETEVDSVKTIMSSTGRSIEDVTKNLDDLRTYADKTIYSLTDMTSNLGKFTNNGVELEDATHAMMGVANAAALAGQGTQQASMAMYNISQAIGVGKMTAIDWKSIENANMATKDLKNAFLEVAAAQNNLKKVTKDGVTTYYYVKDSKGNEIKDQKKWVEVNYKNFREQLSKGWLTSDTITATLAALSGTPMSANAWETQFGITDKSTIKYLEDMGKQALEAASQVRTFTKMMGTLKDAVASGWSQSFKLVFGDAEEATTMWTEISDRIGGILNQSANQRNEILNNWKSTREVLGTRMVDSGSSAAGMVAQTIYGRNGREILIDGIKNLMDVFGSLGNAISRAFSNVFGTLSGGDLFSKTQAFEQLTIRIKEWLGSMDDSNSRLNKIFRIVRGVLSAFKLWKDAIRGVVDTLVRLLLPGTDGVLDVLSKVGDFFFNLSKLKPEEILVKIGDKLKEGWEKLKGLFTPRTLFDQFGNKIGEDIPVITWFNNLWQNLTSLGSQVLTDLGLGGVVSFIESIRGHLETAWATVSGWEGWPVIEKFFGDVWGWLTEKFGDITGWFTTPTEGENKTGFVLFIESVKTKFDSTVNAIKNWPVWAKVKEFFGNVFNWISNNVQSVVGWFTTPTEGENKTGFVLFIESVKTKFDSTVNAIKNWPVWAKVKEFFGNVFNWISNNVQSVTDWFTNPKEGEKTGFVLFLENVYTTLHEAWFAITESEEAKAFWASIGQFFSDTFAWIGSLFSSPSETEGMDNAAEGVKNIAEGTNTISEGLAAIAGDGKDAEGKAAAAGTVFDAIRTFVENVLGKIDELVSSSGIDLTKLSSFFDSLGKFLSGLLDWLSRVLSTIGDVLSGNSNIGALWSDLLGPMLAWFGSQIFIGALNKWTGGLAASETFKNIGIAMLTIAASVVALGQMDQAKLEQGLNAAVVIGAIVTVIGSIVAGIASGITPIERAHPTLEKLGTTLMGEFGKAGMLYIMMKLLPDVIAAIADFKKKTDNADLGTDIFFTLAGVVSAMSIAGIAINLVARTGAGVTIGTSVMAIIKMIAGFAVLLGAVWGITKLFPDAEELNTFAEKAKSLGEAIGGFIGGVFGSLFGEAWRGLTGQMSEKEKAESQRKDLENAVDQLVKLSDSMSEERLGAILDLVDRMGMLRIQDEYYGADIFVGADFAAFAQGFSTFVDALIRVLVSLQGDENGLTTVLEQKGDLVDKFVDGINRAFNIFDGISKTTYEFFRDSDYNKFFQNISSFVSDTGNESSIFEAFLKDATHMYEILSEYGATFASYVNDPNVEAIITAVDNINHLVNSLYEAMNGIGPAEAAVGGIRGLMNIQAVFNIGGAKKGEGSLEYNAYLYALRDRRDNFGFFLDEVENIYSVLQEHSSLVSADKEWGIVKFLNQLNDMLSVFMENGIGSEAWFSNFESFERLSRDTDFIQRWIEAIEHFYAALQDSSLGKDEGITFDGLNVVQRLFEAIEDGMNSPDLPAIDATPVTMAIVDAIGFGGTAIAQAVHDMIQAGLNDSSENPDKYGTYTLPGMDLGFGYDNMFDLFQNGGLEGIFNEDALIKQIQPMMDAMNDPNSPINKMMNQLEAKLGNTLNLNKFMNESGLMFQDDDGKMVNVFSYVETLSNKLSESLNTMDPISFGVTPVFTLDELTRANLQEQLNGLNLSAPVGMPAVSIDFTAMNTDLGLDQIRQKLDGINASIGNWGFQNNQALASLSGHMDGIRDEIARMQMVLDSGVLVAQILPMIDKGLYSRALLEYRSGTAPRNSSQVITLPK